MAAAYGWPADLPDAEVLSRLNALAEDRAGRGTAETTTAAATPAAEPVA